VMGTLHYMAPEQMDNPLKLDHRADIYAVGVVLYEMLTGQLPRGNFPLPSRAAKVDSRLDQVILRALETDPNRRYQRISEIKTAVESLTQRAEPIPEALPAASMMTWLQVRGKALATEPILDVLPAEPTPRPYKGLDLALVEAEVQAPAKALMWA